MASLRKTKRGSFMVCFRFAGRQYQRALKTRNLTDADIALKRVELRIHDLSTGRESIPDGVDPGDFIACGQEKPPVARPVQAPPTFSDLIFTYLGSQRGRKAASTLQTEGIHLRNLERSLGSKANQPISRIKASDLEAALQTRYSEVAGITVIKERQTLISFFEWVVGQSTASLPCSPAQGLSTYQKELEKPRFRTVQEIETILRRGGLSEADIERYWECLYLTEKQTAELLQLVRQRARHDFIMPMVAIAAFSGMRRGEIMRLTWSDVNFDAGFITARSRKQSRDKTETARDIPIHSGLRTILLDYQKQRPAGQFVICRRKSTVPLTVHMAHDHFRRTLQTTSWERQLADEKKRVVVGFHTLRHSFASNLAAKGVDQRYIDIMMGHQTEEMRKRYQHLFPESQRAAIETLDFTRANPDNGVAVASQNRPAEAVDRERETAAV